MADAAVGAYLERGLLLALLTGSIYEFYESIAAAAAADEAAITVGNRFR